jgi:hypothetical protein
MVVERIKTGFLAVPDFKVTEFDRTTSELAGAYAGWLTDQRFLIGGGGYWLTSGSRDRELAYGGLVVGAAQEGSTIVFAESPALWDSRSALDIESP